MLEWYSACRFKQACCSYWRSRRRLMKVQPDHWITYMYLAHLVLHPSERHVAWRGVDSQLVCIFTYAYPLVRLMPSVLCTKIFGSKLEEGDNETGLTQCSSQRSLIAACRMNLPVYKSTYPAHVCFPVPWLTARGCLN